MKQKNTMKKVAIFVLFAIATASCVPQKKMLFLKDAEMATETLSTEYVNDRTVTYKLQPGDNLFIRAINTIDEKGAAAINGDPNRSTTTGLSSESSIYLNSYTVDEAGYIELPLIGKVEVKNLTVEEAKDRLQAELDKFVNQTTLIVKLSSFNLTLVGEVLRPGKYKVYQSQINIFEAISMAGSVTNFAKNSEVKIIRQTDNGSEIVVVDLGQADILSSPYYYMKPNDIIYVEPLKIKQWGFTTFPYSTVFSIISLAATLYLTFRKK